MKQPSSSHHADLRDANPDHRESSLTSRREFLTSVAAVGIGTVLPASGLIAQVASGGGPKGGLIDVHSHYSSPGLVAAIGQKRLGAAVANWVPEKSLEDMDGAGVSTGLLSTRDGLPGYIDCPNRGLMPVTVPAFRAGMASIWADCHFPGAKIPIAVPPGPSRMIRWPSVTSIYRPVW